MTIVGAEEGGYVAMVALKFELIKRALTLIMSTENAKYRDVQCIMYKLQ